MTVRPSTKDFLWMVFGAVLRLAVMLVTLQQAISEEPIPGVNYGAPPARANSSSGSSVHPPKKRSTGPPRDL